MALVPGLTRVAPAPAALTGGIQRTSNKSLLQLYDNLPQHTLISRTKIPLTRCPQFIRNSASTTLTTNNNVALPDEYDTGDLLLLLTFSKDSTVNTPANGEWTLIPESINSGGGINDSRIFYRWADGTESNNFAVTTPAGTGGYAGTVSIRSPLADSANPLSFGEWQLVVDTNGADDLGGSVTPTPFNLVTDNMTVFGFGAGVPAATAAAPTGANIVFTGGGEGGFATRISTLRTSVTACLFERQIAAGSSSTITPTVVHTTGTTGVITLFTLTSSATGPADIAATAALTATSTLTATATREQFATATLSETSTLTATATLIRQATAALSATSTLTATAVLSKQATATLSATSTLTATAVRDAAATAALSATSTLTALANSTVNATAALTATSTLTASATLERFATAALSATSTLTAAAIVSKIATAALSATSTLTTTSVVTRNATVALTATSTLTTSVVRETFVVAALSATSTLTASVSATVSATAALSASSSLTVTNFITRFGTIALTATSTLTADADIDSSIATGYTGWAGAPWGITAWGSGYTQTTTGLKQGVATLRATSTLTVTPTRTTFVGVALTETATLTVSATVIPAAGATLLAIASLIVTSVTASSSIWIELVINNGIWSLASVSTNPYIENVPGAPVYTQVTPSGDTWIEFPVAPKIWS